MNKYIGFDIDSNPSKMTWIYRTAKKNDRIEARKQALLLSIGEIPKVSLRQLPLALMSGLSLAVS